MSGSKKAVFVAVGLVVVAAVVIAALVLKEQRAQYREWAKGYPVEPKKFYAQVRQIKRGMAKDEVLDAVAHYTIMSEHPDGRILFSLIPSLQEKPDSIERDDLRIVVHLDEKGRVTKVTKGER